MTESLYSGFKRIDWKFNDYNAALIFPKEAEPGRRWLWRAEYLGAFDAVDVEMLKRGWHLAYYKMDGSLGDPASVKLMDGFYRYLTKEYGLSEKTVLLGFSRGGLNSVSFAGAYPERTGGLYLDAATIDLFWWPFRPALKDKEKELYAESVKRYGLTEGTSSHPDNPVNKIPMLAANKIPLAIVAGLKDEIVPYERGTKPLAEAYSAAGIDYFIKLKPDGGHHPHSLEDPAPIADYIEKNFK